MDEVKEGKSTSYQGLLDKSRRQGWKIHCEALKVGCRGFIGRSLCKVFTVLGLTGEAKRATRPKFCWDAGLINFGQVPWVRVSDGERPETPRLHH